VKLDGPRMYTIFQDKRYQDRELSVVFGGKARVYAFTFG
jgi:hypothetical protein